MEECEKTRRRRRRSVTVSLKNDQVRATNTMVRTCNYASIYIYIYLIVAFINAFLIVLVL